MAEHQQMNKISEYCEVPLQTMKNYLRHMQDCTSLDMKTKNNREDGTLYC